MFIYFSAVLVLVIFVSFQFLMILMFGLLKTSKQEHHNSISNNMELIILNYYFWESQVAMPQSFKMKKMLAFPVIYC